MNSTHAGIDEGLCPRCGQSGLHLAELMQLNRKRVWLCEECDGLWDQAESPWSIKNPHIDFTIFMRRHGLAGTWDFVDILE